MKKYKFIRMTYTLGLNYRSSEKYGKKGHRDIIRDMAEQGWKFVAQIPSTNSSYDLVFEIDCEN
jgi:hypothetical protein